MEMSSRKGDLVIWSSKVNQVFTAQLSKVYCGTESVLKCMHVLAEFGFCFFPQKNDTDLDQS